MDGSTNTRESTTVSFPQRDTAPDGEMSHPRRRRDTSAPCTDGALRATARDADKTFARTSRYRVGCVVGGRYRLLRPLGQGGMAEVWSAQHLGLKTEVALKFPSEAASADVSAQTSLVQRFRFEAQISAQLGPRTRHVITVSDYGIDASGPYLAMERERGRTLRDELTARGPMGIRELAGIVRQIGCALAEAHALGIVHRDLKPSNVMIADERDGARTVKLFDFGIAKALHGGVTLDRPQETTPGSRLGSPMYMSPEQLNEGTVDARTDLWALGVIAYEALTGRVPFCGRSFAEIVVAIDQHAYQPASLLRPELPPAIDGVFERALAKEPEQRFQSVGEMIEALDAAIGRARMSSRLALTPRMARWGTALLAAATVAMLGWGAGARSQRWQMDLAPPEPEVPADVDEIRPAATAAPPRTLSVVAAPDNFEPAPPPTEGSARATAKRIAGGVGGPPPDSRRRGEGAKPLP